MRAKLADDNFIMRRKFVVITEFFWRTFFRSQDKPRLRVMILCVLKMVHGTSFLKARYSSTALSGSNEA